ncbi:hypothetical protein [Sciscionella marina]|uniref:hypothetical protein n=1 Tax=Sciscionella marina TaxID=508770 RepID=UPI0003A7714A|nr:hypothetical protein [Sciscionella marina]
MPIVSEQYELIIGVEAHAADHALWVVTAATGAVIDQASFPASTPRAGSCRCMDHPSGR